MLKTEMKYMDQCGMSTTSSGNIQKYHTLTACYGTKGSTTKIPGLCKDVTNDLCEIQQATWILD